jgi:hypothetical protein
LAKRGDHYLPLEKEGGGGFSLGLLFNEQPGIILKK